MVTLSDGTRHRRPVQSSRASGLRLPSLSVTARYRTGSGRWPLPAVYSWGLNLLVLYGRWRPGPWLVGLLIFLLFALTPFWESDEPLSIFFVLTQFVILLALLLHPRLRAMATMALAFSMWSASARSRPS